MLLFGSAFLWHFNYVNYNFSDIIDLSPLLVNHRLPFVTFCSYAILYRGLTGRDWGQSNNFCLKWYFLSKNKMTLTKIPKVCKFTYKPQLANYICSFAAMTPIKFRTLIIQDISSWKMFKNIIKLCRFFLHRIIIKTSKKTNETNSGVKCFVYSWGWRHLRGA